ncbi:MAG: NAD(P)H-hydrate dehydratase [Planctomycetota bacterium]|nr:MAG: NAD(P)H-hydrate dehydratase [Planctomycetota bacterium]
MTQRDESSAPLPRLAPRSPDSHKGDFGRALLIGGSQGMAGAIALASLSTLRSGAGLVKLATPSACQPTAAGFEPSLMSVPLPCDADGRIAKTALPLLTDLIAESTVVALGPGLGRSQQLVEVVGQLYRETKLPMVVDADALFALAQQPEVLGAAGGPRVLTPHPGEFARLTGLDTIAPDDRKKLATEFASTNDLVLVLKGHRTVVADPKRFALNTTGNPGMATGGTGDVLTGIITALICQHLTPYDAARLGVHVHGLAGDLAASELGEVSMIAHDLIDFLPTAWQLATSLET